MGSPLGGVYKHSYCSFDLASQEDGELAQCLRDAVARLTPKEEFLQELRMSGGSAMFFVFWYPNGDTGEVFEVGLLKKMAELGIDLGLNVYADWQVASRDNHTSTAVEAIERDK